MTLWPRLAELPLVVESYALERIDAPPGSGYERVTTHVRLLGAGTDGLGEDIYDEQEALLAAGPSLPLAGEWTLAGFCDHLDTLALWPAEPEWPLAHHFRRWTYESAALDLALRQAGRSLHDVLGREPQPVGFVNSLGLGDPPDIATIHRRLDRYPGLRLKLDAVADWTPALMDELAATGAVETVDFKGRYGLDLPALDALLALYDHALTAFPDAVLEDPHDLPEVAERLADHQHRVAYDAPILTFDDLARQPLAARIVNVKPSRIGGLRALLDLYDRCAAEGVRLYGGGMGEQGVGRGQVQLLASLFHPDAHNDVAPGGFNLADPPGGLPASPLPAGPAPTGFRRG